MFSTMGWSEAARAKSSGGSLSYYSHRESAADNQDSEKSASRQTKTVTTSTSKSQGYVVKKGDTLAGIARANNTTVAKLAKQNGLSGSGVLKIGQKMSIPGKQISVVQTKPAPAKVQPKSESAPEAESPKPKTKISYGKYVVKKGDNVERLAEKYGVEADDILMANNLPDNARLKVGRELTIPSKNRPANSTTESKSKTQPTSRENYSITGQETFYGLSQKYNCTVEEIQAANPNVNPNQLRPGIVLKIPVRNQKTLPEPARPQNEMAQELEPETQFSPQQLHSGRNTPQAKTGPKEVEESAYMPEEDLVVRDAQDPYMDYELQPGDNWDFLTSKFKVSKAELQKINGLKGNDQPTGRIQVPRNRYLTSKRNAERLG